MGTTALGDRVLRRALRIAGQDYTLTLDDHGFKLAEKGRRLGLEIKWADLVSGEAALSAALEASLTAPIGDRRSSKGAAAPGSPRRRKSS